MMKNVVRLKFPRFMGDLKGNNPTELENYKVDGHLYLHQSFDFMSDDSPAYFEFGALCIEKPEEYYEIFVTGDRTKQGKHREAINKFLEAVVEWHFRAKVEE